MPPKRFGYVSPARLLRIDGELAIDARSFESLTLMADHLPGTLTVVAPGTTEVQHLPPGVELLTSARGAFDVVVQEPSSGAIDSLGMNVIYGLHSTKTDFLTRGRTPFVLTSEQTLPMRIDLYRADISGINLVRAALGLIPRELQLRQHVLRAASLQCNGPAATRSYGWMKSDTLSFHDSRIHAADVTASAILPAWNGSGRLRLGFSGRFIAIKGPQFAVQAAEQARQRGLPVDLHMFGAGPMGKELQEAAGPNVHFEGFRSFRHEWIPQVQQSVDLMLFPHVQGDPSCTYFEALGSGAPVLAFDNATATPLVCRHKVGWTVPRGDVEALVDQIAAILDDPQVLLDARDAGHRFMADHNFDATTKARAEHLCQQVL